MKKETLELELLESELLQYNHICNVCSVDSTDIYVTGLLFISGIKDFGLVISHGLDGDKLYITVVKNISDKK